MSTPRSERRDLAVVTGGAGGIGRALADALLARGAAVLIADVDDVALKTAEGALAEAGGEVHVSVVDLTDPESVVGLARHAMSLGRISTVCMNAGVTATGATTWDTAPEQFDFMVGVNLKGLFNSIRAFMPVLEEQGGHSDIIITASMVGLVASQYSGAYATSKAGAVALAKALRDEIAAARLDIHLTVLAPGMVRTNLVSNSAKRAPEPGAMDPTLVEISHNAINDQGAQPSDVAAWALRAIDEKQFWALPPASDPFIDQLRSELDELRGIIDR